MLGYKRPVVDKSTEIKSKKSTEFAKNVDNSARMIILKVRNNRPQGGLTNY